MKTLLTITFFFFIGFAAQAQDNNTDVTVETARKEIVTATTKENSVARLYRFKNSRIKKELSFATKKNAAKLA